jgi:sirohydrochlorin cobaltochelatase
VGAVGVSQLPELSAIILFAHGARDPAWALPFQQLQAALIQRLPGTTIKLAFLELMSPSLAEVVGDLILAGVKQITVIPAFMAQGGHLRRDLPALVDDLLREYPGLAIHVTEALGEASGVQDAMADWICGRVGAFKQ